MRGFLLRFFFSSAVSCSVDSVTQYQYCADPVIFPLLPIGRAIGQGLYDAKLGTHINKPRGYYFLFLHFGPFISLGTYYLFLYFLSYHLLFLHNPDSRVQTIISVISKFDLDYYFYYFHSIIPIFLKENTVSIIHVKHY